MYGVFTSRANSFYLSKPKTKKPVSEPSTGPLFVTANVAGVKRWSKLKNNTIQVLSEIYGKLTN